MSLSSSTNRRVSKLNGFTLIELLTVVGIISVLAACVFGSLKGVREKAQGAACISNLNQIRIAAQLYSQDNNGYPPPGHFNQAMKPYVDVGQDNAGEHARSVWLCPSDKRVNKDTGIGPVSYAYNPTMLGWPQDSDGAGGSVSYFEQAKIRWNGVNQPSKKIMYLDADAYFCNPQNRQAALRHSGAVNALFFDGHLETIKPSATVDIYDDSYWGN